MTGSDIKHLGSSQVFVVNYHLNAICCDFDITSVKKIVVHEIGVFSNEYQLNYLFLMNMAKPFDKDY